MLDSEVQVSQDRELHPDQVAWMKKLRRELGHFQRLGSAHKLKLLKAAFSLSPQQCQTFVGVCSIDEFVPSVIEACWSFLA